MGATTSCCTHAERIGGEQWGKENVQQRPSLHVKFGGFQAGDFVAENRGTFEDCYESQSIDLLGEGTTAQVFMCERKDTKQQRAVKVISHKLVSKTEQVDDEVKFLKSFDHPNIVRIFEHFEHKNHDFLVLELCTGGELFDYIVDHAPVSESSSFKALVQMFRAVNYLHQNGIIHRDLKAENWLLSIKSEKLDKTVLKLMDFGSARRLAAGKFAYTKVGLPYYLAPEVIEGKYNHKADVWSVGIIFYMLLIGSPPFLGNSTKEVMKTIEKGTLRVESKKISDEAKTLLKGMLARNLGDRCSAEEILNEKGLSKLIAKNVTAAPRFSVAQLQGYGKSNILEKVSLNAIASQMNREAVADLEKTFLAMDTNGDGVLTTAELMAGLQAVGVNMDKRGVKELLQQLDTDGSGAIDYSEFLAATLDLANLKREDVCQNAFKVFDIDNSGYIDRAELKTLLRSNEIQGQLNSKGRETSVNQFDELYAQLDVNADGKIDYNEFMVLIGRLDDAGKGREEQGS